MWGDVAKWLRRGSAKPLFTGSNPVVASIFILTGANSLATGLNLPSKRGKIALVSRRDGGMADAADLKSAGAILVGSSPSPGTK